MKDFLANSAALICPRVEISLRKNALMDIVKKIALRFFRETRGCPFFLESL
jgi:hypothetical protein